MDEGGSVIIFLFVYHCLAEDQHPVSERVYIIALENSHFQPGLFFISGPWAMNESDFKSMRQEAWL